MATHAASPIRYDVQRMAEDMTAKGWTMAEFARRAEVADMTVIRFLRGQQQSAPTAIKLAKALRRSVRRYFVTDERVSA